MLAHFYLGVVLHEQGDGAEATASYTRAISDPNNGAVTTIWGWGWCSSAESPRPGISSSALRPARCQRSPPASAADLVRHCDECWPWRRNSAGCSRASGSRPTTPGASNWRAFASPSIVTPRPPASAVRPLPTMPSWPTTCRRPTATPPSGTPRGPPAARRGCQGPRRQDTGRLAPAGAGLAGADLALRSKQWEGPAADDRKAARYALRYWQNDAALAGLRDAEELAKLPKDEREASHTFWSEVQYILDKASEKSSH